MAASGKATGKTRAANKSAAKSGGTSGTGGAAKSAANAAGKQPAAKKAPSKKAAAKKPAAKQATKTAAKVPSQRKDEAAPERLAVRAGEKPWTQSELNVVRDVLAGEARRLREEIASAESGIAELIRDNSDAGGEDQADTGSKTFEREHEISLAASHREILGQTERALALIDDGTYGRCESCGNPIGKARLKAFPRATLCMSCKEREERR